MARRPRIRISLARKVSLLFGTAVLLVIVVTLWSPWLHMTSLTWHTMLAEARRVADTAYLSVDLQQQDWAAVQRKLDERWPALRSDLGLPDVAPLLVDAEQAGGGFQQEAIDRLRAESHQRYYWRLQDDESIFRFALAVRGLETDPHPQVLRGIIDVKLPIPHEQGIWNTVVTILAGASGAVLAILVFYLISQRIVLSPVNALRRVAERVATGDLSARTDMRTGDEFQKLSDTFNEMLAHLQAAQEEQEKINRSLDIRLGELAETNVALYESNRLKNEFLANVSHELRTPLVSIIGFAELLRDAWESEKMDRRRLARYSENILTSGRSLLEIINDLLDLAKIEAGKMQLHLSDFCLGQLCNDLIDFLRPLVDKREQKLELRMPDPPPRLHGDSGKIKQILYNLLSNAVKFTPTGGSVTLLVEPTDNGRVRLVVADTGPGIPEAQRENIFEKFKQLDSSATREYEGTGLGLAITKELVDMLGGSIRVESGEGQGATFIVEVPTRITEVTPRRQPLSLT